MSCQWVQARLADYSADRLRARQRIRVEAHIGTCRGCARELKLLGRTMELVVAGLTEEPPRDLWPGLQARLAPVPRVGFRWSVGRLAAAAAVAAILLILVVALWNRPAARKLDYTARAVGDVPTGAHATAYYVRQHVTLVSYDPFADTVGLGLVAAGDSESASR